MSNCLNHTKSFCYTPLMNNDEVIHHRIFDMSLARIYPLYIAKAEKKGRTKEEVDEVIRWLTGYNQKQLERQLEKETTVEAFYAEAPELNPARALITGMICGVRVEDIKN